ncbi:MAG: phosphotransferase [Bryobacteraceae bacterium]
MPELSCEKLGQYLGSVLGTQVSVLRLVTLGETHAANQSKRYGYGTPMRVDYRIAGETSCRTAVLHTISHGQFGHEHMADRAQELLWENQAFNRLPRHIRSLDVGAFCSGGRLIPLGDVEELCLLTEYAEGESYSRDLERLRETDTLTDLDLTRADALCDYLVEIHKVRGNEPGLYLRRIRELVGHGECIMGITDSYPEHRLIPPELLRRIEHLCVDWRWRLKSLTHRLRQVHGDFHPWNILFRSGADFSVLDRSRGEFGDPADDVTSLTMNYLFFSLQRAGRLEGALETLFVRFWRRYIEQSGDREMLQVAAPFVAFRGLVMASPLWYPLLADTVRLKLLAFVLAVLESETFDPLKANFYCGV